jgi:putative hemolysin
MTQGPRQLNARDAGLFRLAGASRKRWINALLRHGAKPLERALAINRVNDIYSQSTGQPNTREFIGQLLENLDISWQAAASQVASIPATGPLLVVANHPFGAVEGLILAALLMDRRPDVKIMANHVLEKVPEFRDLFVLVNPFDTVSAPSQNLTPMRRAMRHLREGGMLGMFPAGEVAHLTWSGRFSEMRWTMHLARLVRHAKCPVLPIYFAGHNSLMFQVAGLAHPRLRTALLARELFKLRGTRVDIQIGSPIPFNRLSQIQGDQEMSAYLRSRTLALASRVNPRPRAVQKQLSPVIPPIPPESLAAEIAALRPEQRVAQAGDLAAYMASAEQIPQILREIGRLREITFRQTGEGTGRELDLDRFDPHYYHLFLWHPANGQIAGAYRVGFTHELLRAHGLNGLYTHSLFNIRRELFDRLGPTLELGRSFVRQEFQKSYAPLLLLWKAIGHIITTYPENACLLGPVSISSSYQSTSRRMMVDFLNAYFAATEFEKLVRPRNALRFLPFTRKKKHPLPSCPDHLSELVSDLEDDGKGVPVLLRQYLKFGARVLSFNVDPDFSDVLDALVYVDLRKTDRRVFVRYSSAEGYEKFMAYHHQNKASAR